MKVTRKAIIAAVVEKTGVKAEYIGLGKYGDAYHWEEKSAAAFNGTCTYLTKLLSVERFVEDFQIRLKEWYLVSASSGCENDSLDMMGAELNRYIESLDWELN